MTSPQQKNASMVLLGIETSCDETAASIVRRTNDGKAEILSNVVLSQIEDHAAYGGVVPEIAARAHISHLDGIVAEALKQANISWSDLSGVAATAGPGLIGGVIVGLMTAKSISLVHNLPLIAVNHLEGHALTARLTDGIDFPYLLLLVSGGHTQLLSVEAVAQYQRLGTTIDDALGEAFDKTAKLLGLGFPGGPAVEHAAKDGNPKRFALPRPLVGRAGCDFSFSGLKTALRRQAEALTPLKDSDIADLCASFQAAICDIVVDRTIAAMEIYSADHGKIAQKIMVIAGGVAANAALRSTLQKLCDDRDFVLVTPPMELCTDNAAMIAWAGAERMAQGLIDDLNVSPRARWPLDPTAQAAPGAGVKA